MGCLVAILITFFVCAVLGFIFYVAYTVIVAGLVILGIVVVYKITKAAVDSGNKVLLNAWLIFLGVSLLIGGYLLMEYMGEQKSLKVQKESYEHRGEILSDNEWERLIKESEAFIVKYPDSIYIEETEDYIEIALNKIKEGKENEKIESKAEAEYEKIGEAFSQSDWYKANERL